MIDKYGDIGHCWSKYIMACVHHGTLIVPDSVIKSPTEQGEYAAKLMKYIEGRNTMKPFAKPGMTIYRFITSFHVRMLCEHM